MTYGEQGFFGILKDQPSLRPAPYLAWRGLTWIQLFAKPGLRGSAFKDYIRQPQLIVSPGQSKKMEVGLGTAAERRFRCALMGRISAFRS